MELYTIFGLNQLPKKLRSTGDSNEFYCYFPPPLPDVVVVFCTNWPEAVPDRMNIQLYLDSEDKSICKSIGKISKDARASCFNGNWERDEQLISEEIQENGRLIKMMVVHDISLGFGLDSQDSGLPDTLENNSPLKDFDSENIGNENEGVSSKIKRKHETSSLLVESKQTPKRTSSVKRKAIFDFDEEFDININKQAKKIKSPPKKSTDGTVKASMKTTPTAKKIPVPSKTKTPKSKTLDSFVSKSPVTPGFFELNTPSPRWGHSFCKIDDDKALVIGGQGLKSQIAKDSIWQYDLSTNKFERILDESNCASRRMGHTAIYDKKLNLVYIFGGSKNKKWYSDINTFDTKTKKWVTVETTGKAPVRAYHSCTLLHDELLIFGGVFPNPDPIPDGCSNDVHFFSTVSNSWYKPIVNGEYPKPRSGHSACFVDGLVYIFAGWDAPNCYNDMWTLDTGLMSFKKMETLGHPPSPRSWHGSSLSSNQQNLIVYGGYNGDIALRDIYVFKIGTKTWSLIGDGNHLAIAGHKILTFKINLGTGGKEEDKTIIFGGGDNEGHFFNEVMQLNQLPS